jgi:hypothetical protein
MALTRLGLNQSINLATNTTGTLGVANGGTGLTSGTTNQFLKFTGSTTVASAAVSAGITMADVWSISTSFTGSAVPLASNWMQSNDASFDPLGSSMTQSSGIFTFPSTGFYYVTFSISTEANNLTPDIFYPIIQVTVNNSSYDDTSYGIASQTNISSGHGMQTTINSLIDVTDTSNVKVRFSVDGASSNVYFNGDTGRRKTYATFIRLGDT